MPDPRTNHLGTEEGGPILIHAEKLYGSLGEPLQCVSSMLGSLRVEVPWTT